MPEIYISLEELTKLVSLRNFMAGAVGGIQTYALTDEKKKLVGEKNPTPDWLLVKLARKYIKQRSYATFHHCEIGAEEDISGKRADEYEGGINASEMPDLAPTGPASLVGKVILELARRLEEEIDADERAERWGWDPGEEVLDDSPAEE